MAPAVGSGTATVRGALDEPDPATTSRPSASCYDLTWDAGGQALGDPGPVAVRRPAHVDDRQGEAAVQAGQAGSADLVAGSTCPCTKAMYDAIGGTPSSRPCRRTSWWFFLPTKKERAKGARWIRCDIGLRAGRTGLDRLPASVALDVAPALQPGRPLPGRQDPRHHRVPATATTGRPRRRSSSATAADVRRAVPASRADAAPELTSSQRYVFDGPSARGVEGRQPLHGLLQAGLIHTPLVRRDAGTNGWPVTRPGGR